ncbi:MAG: SDR family oxidoreductase [Omnitrophica WOR_2 bacterium]
MKKRILVIGGTGMLGQPTSCCLKEAGFQVRILTRDIQKARDKFDSSFEIVSGDPMDTRCLGSAIFGCDGVHISLPTEVEQQVAEAVAKLAPRQGVERITYISGATVAKQNRWFPMVNRKYLAEKALREAGVPYTFLCPTWVMEGLPMFVNQGRAAVFGKQPIPYHWVAADDIARMVSTTYGIGGEANGRFIVHGPEVILMREALRRYCAVFHPEIKQVTSMPFWLVKLLAAVTGNHGLKGAGELLSYFEKVGEGNQKPRENCVLGMPAMTLDRWLQERKAIDDRYRTGKIDLHLVTA